MNIDISYENNLPVHLDVFSIKTYPWHTHKDLQIIYVLKGKVELKMTYERFILKRDSIHIIHPDDVHGLRGLTNDNLVLVLSFNMDHFRIRYPDINSSIFTIRVKENISTYREVLSIKAIFIAIISELQKKHRGYDKRIQELSSSLIDSLYKNFRGFEMNTKEHTIEHKVSRDMIQVERICYMISHVYNNYPYKISLEEIANSENLSKYYLSHLFKQIVGINFRDFVSIVRVEISEVELLDTNHSIAQIAENVGFSNAKYYVSNFENWFGENPETYRINNCNKVVGRCSLDVTRKPLTLVDDIIHENSDSFGFQTLPSQIIQTRYRYPINLSESSNISKHLTLKYDHLKLFTDCVDLIKRHIKDASLADESIPIYDSDTIDTGILTIDGIKKPQYYIMQFLRLQTNQSEQYGDYYRMSVSENTLNIVLFNESPNTQLYEFEFLKIGRGDHLVTTHYLHYNNYFLTYLEQLGNSNSLSTKEIDLINNMTCPEIEFSNISSDGKLTYSVSLKSKDICHIEIKQQQ